MLALNVDHVDVVLEEMSVLSLRQFLVLAIFAQPNLDLVLAQFVQQTLGGFSFLAGNLGEVLVGGN